MIQKPLQVTTLLALVVLFTIPSLYFPVRASTAGPDTIGLSPSSIVDLTGLLYPIGFKFTQQVNIAYSGAAQPTVLALQYVFTYDARIIDVDTTACTTVNTVAYCGVVPDAYAQAFALSPLQSRIDTISGTSLKRLFLSSISSLNPATGVTSTAATNDHATIHWTVVGLGKTSEAFSAADTFYATSSTSAIQPNTTIFYTATDGFFQNFPPKHDVSVSILVASPVTLGQTIVVTVTVSNQGDFPEMVTSMLSLNGTVIDTRTVSVPLGGTASYIVTQPTNIAGVYLFSVTAIIVGFTDPTSSDNTAFVSVTVKTLPLHTADLTGKGAWPDHHHFSISHFGSTAILFGKVSTTGTVLVTVKFTLVKDTVPIPSLSTSPFLCSGASTCEVSIGLGPLNPLTDAGHYSVLAQAFYSTDGVNFFAGVSTKSFSFSVTP
jgi:hypothetical protein